MSEFIIVGKSFPTHYIVNTERDVALFFWGKTVSQYFVIKRDTYTSKLYDMEECPSSEIRIIESWLKEE